MLASDAEYFWVKPVDDDCGEAFDTFDDALREVRRLEELEDVFPLEGPFEIVEVHGDREKVLWRAGVFVDATDDLPSH